VDPKSAVGVPSGDGSHLTMVGGDGAKLTPKAGVGGQKHGQASVIMGGMTGGQNPNQEVRLCRQKTDAEVGLRREGINYRYWALNPRVEIKMSEL